MNIQRKKQTEQQNKEYQCLNDKKQYLSNPLTQLIYSEQLLDQLNELTENQKLAHRVSEFAQYHQRCQSKWDDFLINVKREVIDSHKYKTSYQLLQKLTQVCNEYPYSANIKSLCQQFKEWRMNKDSIANFLDHLTYVPQIPYGGLSNTNLEQILSIFEQHIKDFKSFGILSSDFMVCNIQRRFAGESVDISKQEIQQELQKISKHQSIQEADTSRGHLLGTITVEQLKQLHQNGKTKIACILNTDICVEKGMHWVALFINIEKGHILFFNSVGSEEYSKNLEPLKIYCKELKSLMEETFKYSVTLEFLEDDVQEIHNICGVYCLLFITCQIFEIPYQKVQTLLKQQKNEGESFVLLFKHTLFG